MTYHLPIVTLRHGVLRIDIIRKTLLVERLAKFHRNLVLVT